MTESLTQNRDRLAAMFRWPENIGIAFRELTIPSAPPIPALLIWVEGMASDHALTGDIIRPLSQYQGPVTPEAMPQVLPVRRLVGERALDRVVHAVLEGQTALLAEGLQEALLLETQEHVQHHAGKQANNPNEETFARDLKVNVALLRKRLRDPNLLALPVQKPPGPSGGVAILYREDKADPRVVRQVRRWAACHAGEEAAARGVMAGFPAVLGLLPRLSSTPWVDKVALMVDAGYVAVVVDRLHQVYLAPVTYAGWLMSPSDAALRYPLKHTLVRMRTLFVILVLLLPGTVVALLNYHQEMIPTAFLLAIASTRENAPFGIFFEVLLVETLVEIAREASFRLPQTVPIGSALVATILVVLLGVQTGFVGPLSALAAVAGAIVSLALPSFGSVYMVRSMRYLFLLAAVILGYFGMATIFALWLTYLCQARSWGVPFFGPSGADLTAPEAVASSTPVKKGGKRSGKTKTLHW